MKLCKIWFDKDYIYGADAEGNEVRQSLLWYPLLLNASDSERNEFKIGFQGIHWRGLDTDISFESFEYPDAQPSPMQRFFLTHKEIKLSEFAKRIGIQATLLRNYINGFKRPSKEREKLILKGIHSLASEYAAVSF